MNNNNFSLKDLHRIFSELYLFFNQNNLEKKIRELDRFSTSSNSPLPASHAGGTIKILGDILSKFHYNKFYPMNESILKAFDFEKFLGDSGEKYFGDLFNQIALEFDEGKIRGVVEQLHKQLRDMQTASVDFNYYYPRLETQQELEPDYIEIEIIFQDGASINAFDDAKKQMEAWAIIFHGYAIALDQTSKDFEILSITKSSPAKFIVKTLKKNSLFVLSIIASITSIQKTTLESRIMEKQLSAGTYADEKIQKQFTDSMAAMRKTIEDEKINYAVKEALKKTANTKDPEKEIALNKSIQTQYNFETKGGQVNVYINAPSKEEIDQLQQLQSAKKELADAQEKHKELSEHKNHPLLEESSPNKSDEGSTE